MLLDDLILRDGRQEVLDEISETLKKGEISRLDAPQCRGHPLDIQVPPACQSLAPSSDRWTHQEAPTDIAQNRTKPVQQITEEAAP
jgi:hypothetical protein